MNYLAIDTSGTNLTVVVRNNGKYYKYFDATCGVSHSVSIMPIIEALILQSGIDLKSADFIACVVGAGSFTGIRIGVSTAKALAMAYSLKVLSVSSFDCLAYNKQEEKVLSVINAKHGAYYVCGYDKTKVILPPKYMLKAELDQIKDEYKLVASEDILGLEVTVVSLTEGLINAVEHKAELASEDVNSLQPLYCRKSQAEEGRL